jgi:hypothetical protein
MTPPVLVFWIIAGWAGYCLARILSGALGFSWLVALWSAFTLTCKHDLTAFAVS